MKYSIKFLRLKIAEDYSESYEALFSAYAEYNELSSKTIVESNLSQKIDDIQARFLVLNCPKIREITSKDFIKFRGDMYKILTLPRVLDNSMRKYEIIATRVNQ